MRLHSTRKQTENLRSYSSSSGSAAHHIARKNLTPMRASGILFAGIAATAGVSTLAFALQYHSKPANQTIAPTVNREASPPAAPVQQSTSDTSVTIDNSQTSSSASTTTEDGASQPAVTGQATINNEVIPLTEGTVQRSFTDSNGTEHTVTISLDGQSTVVQSNTSNSDIQIYSSSSSSGTNTTRGSPPR